MIFECFVVSLAYRVYSRYTHLLGYENRVYSGQGAKYWCQVFISGFQYHFRLFVVVSVIGFHWFWVFVVLLYNIRSQFIFRVVRCAFFDFDRVL